MEEKKKSTAYSMFVIGSLFFVFGFVTWLNNILIPYMRTSCELTTQVQGYLVTFAFYIAYFASALSASPKQNVRKRKSRIRQSNPDVH